MTTILRWFDLSGFSLGGTARAEPDLWAAASAETSTILEFEGCLCV